MDEIPERAMLWLDRDVATWLHRVADERYGGDVEQALNIKLTVAMLVDLNPEDPWRAIVYEARTLRRR